MSTATRHTISADEAIRIVTKIRAALYEELSEDTNEFELNPDKEWSFDTIELIAEILDEAGIVPNEPEPAQPVTLG